MVRKLQEHYHIRDERVLNAMFRVPRHFFVPEALKAQAYKDMRSRFRRIRQFHSLLSSQNDRASGITSDSKILEIGAGSGYQTAILAHFWRKRFLRLRESRNSHSKRRKESKKLGFESNAELRGRHEWLGSLCAIRGILVAAGSPVTFPNRLSGN